MSKSKSVAVRTLGEDCDNVDEDHIAAFAALSGFPENFGLVKGFVNGSPTSVICRVEQTGPEQWSATPVFVAITDDMILTNAKGDVPIPGGVRH